MHKVSRKALHSALTRAGKIVRRPGIPALTGVLVDANELGLRLTTTDLETSYRTTVDGSGDGSWSALPPAKALKDALGKISDETVGLEHSAEASTLTVVRENGARISFRTLAVEDFPSMPVQTGTPVRISADGFRRVFGSVLPFVSPDTARPTLTGILIEFKDKGPHAGLLAVSTDSYRLGVAIDHDATAPLEFANVIVPGHVVKESLAELGKGSEDVRFTVGMGTVTFELPSGAQWQSRLIEGQFPNWQQLMPETFEGTLTFDLAEALEAVKTAELIAGENTPMRLELNGHVRITAGRSDEGTFDQTLAGTTYAGEEMNVAYNPGYFGECLRATNGAPMRLRDALKPAMFGDLEADGRAVLLMPVRLPAPVA